MQLLPFIELEDAASRIRVWAGAISMVQRVWIFGSRAKGNNKPESDLDVAIEIDATGTDSTAILLYIHNIQKWSDELQMVTAYKLDLELYDPAHVVVYEGVNKYGILIYSQ